MSREEAIVSMSPEDRDDAIVKADTELFVGGSLTPNQPRRLHILPIRHTLDIPIIPDTSIDPNTEKI